MTTDITELAQSLKAAAENAIGAHERLSAYPYGEIIDISQHEGEQIDIDITDINEFHEEASPANILALAEALEKARQRIDELENDEVCQRLDNAEHQLYMAELAKNNLRASRKAQFRKRKAAEQRIAGLESRTVKLPDDLHPDTQELVIDFCTALAEKLYKAQLKYGYDADWKNDGWPSQCQAHFHQHIVKGDPRDVAAYCAFMWWHGWSTKPAEGLESRTVTVKLPDYKNTYKSPFADEVEHQVRLALELFSSAAGIKVEAE
ncbi:TPA: ead/Ea22-like family protein [Klebsiella pneumoniae]|nr:ead/Ea22-like family protein [Klebsiella pneumoniae]HBW4757226.1 ead/Ea22-like family protein [Klebsiella pneumoniae]HBW6830773.1 ead/Ea22-like family protein [Klebsiella pneumoniae]